MTTGDRPLLSACKPCGIAIAAMLVVTACAATDPASHAGHQAAMSPGDTRQPVRLPATLHEHTLANMRDHLATLQQVEAALAGEDYRLASALAEERLGLTSLELHGAHDVGPYMPQPM